MPRTVRSPTKHAVDGDDQTKPRSSLDAEIIIANAPDPVFVSDLEGKILQANDAVSELLGFGTGTVLSILLLLLARRAAHRSPGSSLLGMTKLICVGET